MVCGIPLHEHPIVQVQIQINFSKLKSTSNCLSPNPTKIFQSPENHENFLSPD